MISAEDILRAGILIVDDNETNVHLLQGMLRIAGYVSVESTTNPREVCDLYSRNRYSLIILDLEMPGMDGFEVMAALNEAGGDSYLPVIATTAEPRHKLRALKAGAKDFIDKPFEMAELRARVRNIIEIGLLYAETAKLGKLLAER